MQNVERSKQKIVRRLLETRLETKMKKEAEKIRKEEYKIGN